eukprot:gene522-11870_t
MAKDAPFASRTKGGQSDVMLQRTHVATPRATTSKSDHLTNQVCLPPIAGEDLVPRLSQKGGDGDAEAEPRIGTTVYS